MNVIKATGIVRRIDELGRVVIPREIRRTIRICQGDALEIYTSNDGDLILKKYSPIEDFAVTALQLAEASNKACGFPMIVMTKDIVVACAGVPKKDIIQQKISLEVENLINARQLYAWWLTEEKIPVLDMQDKYFVKSLMPIFSYGDPIGAVAVIGINNLSEESTESEIKIIKTAAVFLGKQTDD
jgi:AbrB family transcriptional regulator (stage V sporulation protein T)